MAHIDQNHQKNMHLKMLLLILLLLHLKKVFCLLVGIPKAQEDIAGGQKREEEEVEEEGEDPYNEENIEQVGYSAGNQRILSFFLREAFSVLCFIILFPKPKMVIYIHTHTLTNIHV